RRDDSIDPLCGTSRCSPDQPRIWCDDRSRSAAKLRRLARLLAPLGRRPIPRFISRDCGSQSLLTLDEVRGHRPPRLLPPGEGRLRAQLRGEQPTCVGRYPRQRHSRHPQLTTVKSEKSAFWQLAAFHGITSSYTDAQGEIQRASPDVVTLVLRGLGVPLEDPNEAAALLHFEQAAALERCLEPVLVHRIGRQNTITATVLGAADLDAMWLSIELEQGDTVRMRLREAVAGAVAESEAGGKRYQHVRLNLSAPNGEPLPPGRHQVSVDVVGLIRTAVLLSAPDCPAADRQTGVFMPLHALRTVTDWGIGSYTELERFSGWAASEGCGLVGTLPLYPAFLDPPADPSPYLPVSRLAYNEVFIDPVALPEFAACPDVRELCSSAQFRAHLDPLRSSRLVDYEGVLELKRSVLEHLAQVVTSGALPRRQSDLAEFVALHPELQGYARFRARLDSPTGEECAAAVAYHLYCQWAAHEQLVAAGRHA